MKKLPSLNQSKSQKSCLSDPISPYSTIKSAFNSEKSLFTSSNSKKPNKEASSNYLPSAILNRMPNRAKLIKNKALLAEMGFKAELDFKPINLNESSKESGKLYSIQMVDFWGDKEKIKFLKKQGYWEAYKDMISESKKSKLYYNKTFKQPVSPQVLDITTSHKAQKALDGSFSSSFHHKPADFVPCPIDSPLKSVGSYERLEKLEKIESKFFKLENDSKNFKKVATEFRSEISSKFNAKGRKKLSRFDISQIKKNINSFRYDEPAKSNSRLGFLVCCL